METNAFPIFEEALDLPAAALPVLTLPDDCFDDAEPLEADDDLDAEAVDLPAFFVLDVTFFEAVFFEATFFEETFFEASVFLPDFLEAGLAAPLLDVDPADGRGLGLVGIGFPRYADAE
ncbi:MAG: hypothetical protein H7210_06170 [Pyrinomonadaceae bacterium]|nr:hypothetical protein [Phycisphaerales bacterium]